MKRGLQRSGYLSGLTGLNGQAVLLAKRMAVPTKCPITLRGTFPAVKGCAPSMNKRATSGRWPAESDRQSRRNPGNLETSTTFVRAGLECRCCHAMACFDESSVNHREVSINWRLSKLWPRSSREPNARWMSKEMANGRHQQNDRWAQQGQVGCGRVSVPWPRVGQMPTCVNPVAHRRWAGSCRWSCWGGLGVAVCRLISCLDLVGLPPPTVSSSGRR